MPILRHIRPSYAITLLTLLIPLKLYGWGTTPKITTPVGTLDDTLRAIALQSDGSLIVTGRSKQGINDHDSFIVSRYCPDGTLDLNFGDSGHAIYTPPGGEAVSHAIVLQSDGKILTSGRFWSGSSYDFCIHRYTSTGTIDTTFSSDGRYLLDMGPGDFSRSIIVQSDGKILASGYSQAPSNYNFTLIRLNTDGTLDNTFGTAGILTTPIGSAGDQAYGIALDSSDNIILAGNSSNGSNNDFAIAKYLPAGTLDTTFATDGIETIAIGGRDDTSWGVELDSSGNILAIGRSHNGSNYDFAISSLSATGEVNHGNRFTVGSASDSARGIYIDDSGNRFIAGRSYNGSNWDFSIIRTNASTSFGLDTSFGTGGFKVTSVGSVDALAYDHAVFADGKIIVAGAVNNDKDFLIVKHNQDGSLDNTFDGDGVIETAVNASNDDIAYAIALEESRGYFYAAGRVSDGSQNDFAIARYLTSGPIDTTFDTDGIITTSVNSSHDSVHSIVPFGDGRFVVGGETYNGSNKDFVVARYVTSGALDAKFNGGVVQQTVGSGDESINKIALAGGAVTSVGYTVFGSNRLFAITRHREDGAIDTAFGTLGIIATPIAGNNNNIANDVIIQSDGKVIVAGSTSSVGSPGFGLIRFFSDGSLDTSFGTGGSIHVQPYTHGAELHAIEMQNDKIVAVGHTIDLQNAFVVTRFNSNGEIDATFGTSGIEVIDLRSSNTDVAFSATVKLGKLFVSGITSVTGYDQIIARFNLSSEIKDATFGSVLTPIGTGHDVGLAIAGRGAGLFVVGKTANGSNFDFGLVRYFSDGSLLASATVDDSLDSDGVVLTDSGTGSLANAVVTLTDGSFVVGGASDRTVNSEFLVAKYSENGQLDASFGNSGIALATLGTDHEIVNALALQTDGKYIAVGTTESGTEYNIGVARFLTTGDLDVTFSADGRVTSDFNFDDFAYSSVIDDSDRILVAGATVVASNSQFAAIRYTSNGALDGSFGASGISTTNVISGGDATAYDLAVQTDGNIVLVGHVLDTTASRLAIVRYQTNGDVDTTFSTDGIVTRTINTTGVEAYAVGLQADGKIVVTGKTIGITSQIFLSRFLTDGTIDTTYSSDGVALLSIGTLESMAHDLKISQSQKAIIVGQAATTTGSIVAMARVSTDGTLDTDFGGSGTLTTSLGGNESTAYGMAIDYAGRIIAVGRRHSGTENNIAALRVWQ